MADDLPVWELSSFDRLCADCAEEMPFRNRFLCDDCLIEDAKVRAKINARAREHRRRKKIVFAEVFGG